MERMGQLDDPVGDRSPAPRRARDAVLMLHGQPGCGALWDPVARAVERRLSPLAPTVIAPDRPGWGAAEDEAQGLAGNADAALAELDRHGVDRAVVVGHSFGGAVALALAAKRPDRVASLVLVAPAADEAAINRVDRVLASPLVGTAASFFGIGAAETVLRRPKLRRIAATRGKGALPSAVALAAPAAGARRHWRSFAVEQRALIDEIPPLGRSLASIEAPALVLAGHDDHAVPLPAVSAVVDRLPSAELLELDGAGHQLPLEAADTVAAAVAVALGRAQAA